MNTTTLEIPRDTWRSYFDELTKVLGTERATVEVVGRDLGDQLVDEHQLLTDMTYDPRSDAIIVALDVPDPDGDSDGTAHVVHTIDHPQRVLVAAGEPPPLEMTYDIQDGDGHQWLIRLERPPALPPATS
jgi:Family of unknown function (DUF5335)